MILVEIAVIMTIILPLLALFYLYRYPITLVPVPPRFNQRSKKIAIKINQEIEELYQKLKKTIVSDDLYLKKDLKISELSSKSDLIPAEIRIVLNENGFDNFKDFCNHYRLLNVEKKLHRGDLNKYTMQVIYEKSGFNSHQTFIRCFRKKHGMTAIEYHEKRKLASTSS